MPLDTTHIEWNEHESKREQMSRADLTYTKTQTDLMALQLSAEQQIDSIIRPIVGPEHVQEILAHPEKVHCLVIAGPNTLTRKQMQSGMMQATTNENTVFWSLDPQEKALLDALGVSFSGAGTYVMHQGKLVDTITQPLTGAGWDQVTQGVLTGNQTMIATGKQLILGNDYSQIEITKQPTPKGKYDDLTITVVPTPETNTKQPAPNAPSSTNTTSSQPKQTPGLSEVMQISNGIDISHLNWYIEGVHVKKLDPRVYSLNGNLIPESREKFKISNNMISINGVDEGFFRFDADMVYINPNGYRTNVEYQATELKLKEKLSYKLQVDGYGNLRVAVAPGSELAKKYKEKTRVKRKKVILPELPKAPTLDEIVQQLKDLRPEFEGDPDAPETNLPDPEEGDAVEMIQPGALTFKGQKINQIYTSVYGVPPEWLHTVKVEYDESKKSFRIYKDGKIFSTLDNVSLQQMENGSYSFKYSEGWFSKKITHEGFFNATVDELGRLTVFWGDETYPGYESAESPHGRVLPFVPNANTVITDRYGSPRAKTKNGVIVGTRPHEGIDIGMPEGTQINTVAGGTVVEVQNRTGYGNQILIDHGNGHKTRYAHLKLNSYTVKVGQKVVAGQKIGEAGHTGNSRGPTGNHLHFEVIEDGKTVNPAKYIDFTRFDRFKKLRGTKPRIRKTLDANNVFVGATEVGMASYYDDHGNTTASGIVFDQMGKTCAHNVYPFGTVLRVTNLKTGKSEEVIVKDTGNFDKHGKIIDLSKGTMLRLGGTEAEGEYRVRTEVIKIGDRKITKSGVSGGSKNSGGSAQNPAPKTTPTPAPKPNTSPETKNPPSLANPAEYIKNPVQDIITVAFTDGNKSYKQVKSMLAPNARGSRPGEHSVNAPRGWLVGVQNGKPVLVTEEGVKSLSGKSVTVGGVVYTIKVNDISTTKTPGLAQFSLRKP